MPYVLLRFPHEPRSRLSYLNLPDLPTMRPATITGFRIKMWGIYPTLIPVLSHESGSVSGTVWKVTSKEQFDSLAAYETDAYRWHECEAVLENGEVTVNCPTFCWAGDPDDKELEGGEFDLKWYQTFFKPSVTRHRSRCRKRRYEEVDIGLGLSAQSLCLRLSGGPPLALSLAPVP
jgi:hypothetical protein